MDTMNRGAVPNAQRAPTNDRRTAGDGEAPGVALPRITLPKGGGAIRGIGEKFAANPVSGTAALSVPIAISQGRAGFGPQLALSYDSGAGSGPFGLGWSLSLPAITRKTDRGLPTYTDADEADTFVLSGAEDLVPVLKHTNGAWQRDSFQRSVDGAAYQVQRYRPRIEGGFARIERWTDIQTGEAHWRSITRDNITTLYGRTAESRIVDPNNSARIFSWLICESFDDKGNAIRYEYKPDDEQALDLRRINEANRSSAVRSTNRYPKRILYGNRTPRQPGEDLALRSDWLFAVVFDYGEHYTEDAQNHSSSVVFDDTQRPWSAREDAFSTYRAGFEIRSYRLCRRVLMFHHFPNELGAPQYLVRATHFGYSETPIASFITTVTQSAYRRQQDGTYRKRSLPSLELVYSQATIQEELREVDPDSMENLPSGLDGAAYRWADLDGEGLSGLLSQQGGAWFYKRNLSALPMPDGNSTPAAQARFAPVERVASLPAQAALNAGRQQLMDLAGDGQLDLVQFDPALPGFFERTDDGDWSPFTLFRALPNLPLADPSLKFVDLTGDGRPDILITGDDNLVWYPSLAEAGFGPANLKRMAPDEERGPRLVFADGEQSLYLADCSGDGLDDLVRIRNGEVCYWPNLGYGRFGAKVAMENAPRFDAPDQFDQRRIRLADIDGSGLTDIIYLGRDGVALYFNQAGNSWSPARTLAHFPPIDDLAAVTTVDLLGNGTACLAWSSPLPGAATRPMRYIDLMGGQKPHLLIQVSNNVGAETHVRYAPSTRFYLADRAAGTPWVTRLPFPVHVVERVETYDRISRNRFVTRYAYHHGYFDGVEREFRGFGMVEQWDTEEFAALSADGVFPSSTNIDAASHVPPILTRTWFHTGAYFDSERISRQFEREYYREPGLSDAQLSAMRLDDTLLPAGLSAAEEREACRALKGAMLRQEVYARDGSAASERPYSVAEQNYTIRPLQPIGPNQHAVFFTHAREAISFAYDRALYDFGSGLRADPRVSHALTLAVDDYGNVQQAVAIGYGRRFDDADPLLSASDRQKQRRTLATYIESSYTNPIALPDAYRAPLPCQARTYELLKLAPAANQPQVTSLFRFDEIAASIATAGDGQHELPYEDIDAAGATGQGPYRRLIEHARTLYRRDDLTGALPLAQLEPLALPFESYQLALTPGLVAQTYGARATDAMLAGEGRYVHLQGDANWWIPSGRVFYSPAVADSPAQELAAARQHFFLPRRFHDPFGQVASVTYDGYDLLQQEVRDPLGNVTTVLTQDDQGAPLVGLDYRVLQPWMMVDPNGNRAAVAFDTLGLVAGTAVMGKWGALEGDSLAGFAPDLDDATIAAQLQNPLLDPGALLGQASMRMIYDMFAFQRTANDPQPQPNVAYTLSRETHAADLAPGETTRFRHAFGYSDGFGRVIQQKIQAEPGPLVAGGPDVAPRWTGSGWTILNNKGQPVKQYEPFFSMTHRFEFAVIAGVSPTLCYDPLGRQIATLRPDHSYTKVVHDPWRVASWDANDTVLQTDPALDPDVGGWFQRLPDDSYLPTWHAARANGQLGAAEQTAAQRAAAHAGTPTVAYMDAQGGTRLTIADNGAAGKYAARVELDIEGNTRSTSDARGRTVMVYSYDMLGTATSQTSMEAGTRTTLHDIAGKPLHTWDSRDHHMRSLYDALQRPTHLFVRQGSGPELLAERTIYGEAHPDALARNLRGKLYQQYDGAGAATSEQYDFKGNLLLGSRRLAASYHGQVDWSALAQLADVAAIAGAAAPLLEAEQFNTSTTYDALNRPIALTTPDQSTIHPVYNEANLLEGVGANLRGAATATQFIGDIDYDAKGQRVSIAYANGVTTSYSYDPLTFRLVRLQTLRAGTSLQDLNYTYDPSGNITAIRDDAQQTVYFDNQVVAPSASYTYDALYRLIGADGREHIGQLAQPQPTYDDAPRMGQPHPGDGAALRRYGETYAYDEVGNILSIIHAASGGNWTRSYTYNEPSLVEPAKANNRLSKTAVGAISEPYTYDAHGNMTSMPHLAQIDWDFKDQMQRVDLGGGGTAYYVYDSAGQRVRKVVERIGGQIEERIYQGGCEIYRVRNANGLKLERETLHIIDGARRVAQAETKTVDADAPPFTPVPLIRYQHDNHLGSASLELDDAGKIITYEEYYPYGSTAYQAVRSGVEASPKRYRYTGKERDEESGLYYHGARYYAPWLGRWTSCDPAGMVDGPNLYQYTRGNPINFNDPSGHRTEPLTPEQIAKLKHFHTPKIGTGTFYNPRQSSPGKFNVTHGGKRAASSPPPAPKPPAPAPAPGKPAGGAGGAAPAPPPAGGTKSTELDRTAAVAGLANFATTSDDGVSGGIPGGSGAKENASEIGQLAYIALSVISASNLAEAAWGLAKAAIGALGSAWRTITGRIIADSLLREAATGGSTALATAGAGATRGAAEGLSSAAQAAKGGMGTTTASDLSRLTTEELSELKQHVAFGREMIDNNCPGNCLAVDANVAGESYGDAVDLWNSGKGAPTTSKLDPLGANYHRPVFSAQFGTTWTTNQASISELENIVRGWGDGGRGIIFAHDGFGAGHFYNVVNVRGVPVPLDARSQSVGQWTTNLLYDIIRTK